MIYLVNDRCIYTLFSIALWPLLWVVTYRRSKKKRGRRRSTPTDSDQATAIEQEVERGGVVCISLVGCIIFLGQWAHHRQHNRPHNIYIMLSCFNVKYFVLVLLVIQNTFYVLLVRYTRTRPGTMYLSSTAVCCDEVNVHYHIYVAFHFSFSCSFTY